MVDNERGIVTPEAVLLEFETAGVGSRTVAILIDLLAQFAAIIGLVLILGAAAAGGLPEIVGTVSIIVGLFLVIFGYPIAFETLWGGRTLGKAAMGLRVVTREGGPVRFRHAAIRGALGLVDLYLLLGAVAVVTSLLTKEGQRLGDLAAGTLVLRERTAAGHADSMVFPVPRGWEAYVASLDVSGVTTDQYGLVRDYLLRVNDLSRDARWHLGVRLANPIARAIHHDPPPGVPAESFLLCVAAAYQQRRGVPAGPTSTLGVPRIGPQGAPAATAARPDWTWGTTVGAPGPGSRPSTTPAVPPPPGARPDTSIPPPPTRAPAPPVAPPPVSPDAPPPFAQPE